MIRKIKGIIVIILSLVMLLPMSVYAAEDDEYVNIISSYYEYINNGEAHRIQELYGGYLKEFVASFFENENNVLEHNGIYNVINANIVFVKYIESTNEYSDGKEIYNNVHKYIVKCEMDVYESDKYYQQGYNYFLFSVGYDDEKLKIIDIEIPSYNLMVENDTSIEDVDIFRNVRNNFIYGSSTTISPYAADSSVYIDYVGNPSKIRVQGYSTPIDFMEYCRDVAACEINTLEDKNGAIAAAMAIKMFSMHFVNNAASGADYDINTAAQSYIPGRYSIATSNIKNAMNTVENYYLLGPYGENFKAFYRKKYAVIAADPGAAFCVKNGGVLSQLEADSFGSDGMDWKDILKYYYTRVSGTSYYNSHMNKGTLIITTGHNHDWSNASYCPTCGALVE